MKRMPMLKTAMTPFPYSIDLDASFEEASELMGHHDVHHLPVTRGRQVVGVITDRDIASVMHLQSQAKGSGGLSVRELHMSEPYIVSIDEPLANVLLTMAEKHLGSAVVTRAGKLVGMFTAVDACRSFGDYLRDHYPQSGGNDVA